MPEHIKHLCTLMIQTPLSEKGIDEFGLSNFQVYDNGNDVHTVCFDHPGSSWRSYYIGKFWL